MSVTIKNLLSIDLFKDAEIAAGKNGLNNKIGRINFTDCPIPDDIRDSGLIKEGDLFISSFYIVKEDDEMFFDSISAYIDCECSGTFIITEYIKKLPTKIKELCNSHDFPVIFIDSNIPYAEVIKTTMEMIIADKSETINEMKIEKILGNDASKKLVIDTAQEINRNFKKHYASFYIKFDDFIENKKQMIISNVKNILGIETIIYKNGIFFIANFNKLTFLDSYYSQIDLILGKYNNIHHLGISNTFQQIEDFNDCLKQSMLAYEISNILESNTVYYKDINLYKILYPLKNSEVLKDFYLDIFNPLIGEEDNKDNYELINTIQAYLNCDGDYKKVAVLLNQHENTVRYRISKAKRLLNLENNNFKFIEQVSIALKIKNILKLQR